MEPETQYGNLPELPVDERLSLLEGRMLELEKVHVLFGLQARGGKSGGSRLSNEARIAAYQLIRILNQTLADTGFDTKTLKSWATCAQVFEREYTAIINQLEPGADNG